MTRRLLPLGLILLTAVLLAPLCRGLVREVVVIPFLYLFWLLRFVLEAVPQVAIWYFVTALLTVILLAGFVQRRRGGRRAKPPAAPPKNRIEAWAELIEQARQEDYFKWRLGQSLQKLTLRQFAHQQSQSIGQTRRQLRNEALPLPSTLQAYFQASLQPLGYLASPRRFFFWRSRPPSPLDLEPAEVITFLEQLERTEATDDN